MSQTNRFSPDGVTTLNVYKKSIDMDYFGQGVTIKVPTREDEEPNPQGEFKRLHRALLEVIDRAITKDFDNADVDRIMGGKRDISRYMAPLLVFTLSQARGGIPFLKNVRLAENPSANTPRTDTLCMHPTLLPTTTKELTIHVDVLTLDTIQGTVVFANKQYTCLAFRDLSAGGTRRSSLVPMLDTLGAANQICAGKGAPCIPQLLGYVDHQVRREGGRSVRLVGALIAHMPGARSWAVLRQDQEWQQTMKTEVHTIQRAWAKAIRKTLELLHDKNLFWGGTVGVKPGGWFSRLLESVDVDDKHQPWLVRNYGGDGVSKETAMQSDMSAIDELSSVLCRKTFFWDMKGRRMSL